MADESSPILDAIRSNNSWSNLKADIQRVGSLFTSDTFKGFVQGNTSGILGAPIDIVNTLISPVTKRLGVYTPTPVGGAQSWRNLMGQGQGEDDNIQKTYGSLFSPAGAVKTLGVAVPAAKAMIIAAYRTKDPDLMIKAAQMDKLGATGQAIFQTHGVYRGPIDRQWRAVLDSKNAETIAPLVALDKGVGLDVALGAQPLEKVLKFPELYAAYPELRTMPVIPKATGEFGSAAYSYGTKSTEIAPQADARTFTSVLIHEVEHGIQDLEGFTRGGSQKEFFTSEDKFKAAAKKLRSDFTKQGQLLNDSLPHGVTVYNVKDTPEAFSKFIASPAFQKWEQMGKTIDTLQDYANYAYTKYLNMGGEAEARAAQNIFESGKLTPTRKIEYPVSSGSTVSTKSYYDIPENALIDPAVDARPRDSALQPLLDAILRN